MLNVVCRVRRIDSEFNLPFSDCDNPCCNRVPRFCHTTLDLDFSGSTISRPFHPSESFVIKSHQLCFRTVFMLALYIALLVRVVEIISQIFDHELMRSLAAGTMFCLFRYISRTLQSFVVLGKCRSCADDRLSSLA